MLSEAVTVVLENPTDWTGPVVGILGVVLGALMGLAGIRWQHDAQRAYDVRKLCAAFIHDGEQIRDTVRENLGSFRMPDVDTFLHLLRTKSGEMTRMQRQLELVAGRKVDVAAQRYWEASEAFLNITEHYFNRGAQPPDELMSEANATWTEARDELVAELKPRQRQAARPGRQRFKAPKWLGGLLSSEIRNVG